MTDAQVERALQNLINGTTSAEEINLLRQKVSAGQISINGDANHPVIILGDSNTVIDHCCRVIPAAIAGVVCRYRIGRCLPLRCLGCASLIRRLWWYLAKW